MEAEVEAVMKKLMEAETVKKKLMEAEAEAIKNCRFQTLWMEAEQKKTKNGRHGKAPKKKGASPPELPFTTHTLSFPLSLFVTTTVLLFLASTKDMQRRTKLAKITI